MARVSDPRQSPLFWLRSFLRLARRLSDVADVLFVGPVRMAELAAQAPLGLCPRPPAPARIALCVRHPRSHANRLLSGLSGDRRQPERQRLFAALCRAAVPAEWPAV